MNEEQYQGLIDSIDRMNESVTNAVYGTNDPIADRLQHISGQLDIMNQSIYVANEYIRWGVVSAMLLAALAMFLTGYLLTRK